MTSERVSALLEDRENLTLEDGDGLGCERLDRVDSLPTEDADLLEEPDDAAVERLATLEGVDHAGEPGDDLEDDGPDLAQRADQFAGVVMAPSSLSSTGSSAVPICSLRLPHATDIFSPAVA
jgi:hypothetical protein